MSSSKLSADVPPFYPRYYFGASNANNTAEDNKTKEAHDVDNVPAYMTNCYPFVQEHGSFK